MRALSQLDVADIAFDYDSNEPIEGPRLKMHTLQHGAYDD